MDNIDKVTKALVMAKVGRQESERKSNLWRFIEGSEEDVWEKEKAALEKKQREREMKRSKERLKYKKKYEKPKNDDVATCGSSGRQNRIVFGAREADRGGIKSKAVEDEKSHAEELNNQRNESSCCIF